MCATRIDGNGLKGLLKWIICLSNGEEHILSVLRLRGSPRNKLNSIFPTLCDLITDKILSTKDFMIRIVEGIIIGPLGE